VKQIKLLWRALVLAAAFGCVFFYGCIGNTDVDETLRWKNKWDIPVKYQEILPVGEYIKDAVNAAANSGIAAAVHDLGLDLGIDVQSAIADVISESENLIREIDADDFGDILLEFMTGNNEVARELLRNPDVSEVLGQDRVKKLERSNTLSLEDIIKEVVGDENFSIEDIVDEVTQEVDRQLGEDIDDQFVNLGTNFIPALEGLGFLNKIENPSINCVLDVVSETTFKIKLYVLLFEENNYNYIHSMPDSVFHRFVERGEYERSSGYVNLFYDEKSKRRVLDIEGDGKSVRAPPLPQDASKRLCDFVVGNNALAWRWMAKIEGDIGSFIKSVGQEYLIDVNLSISIEGTNTLDIVSW